MAPVEKSAAINSLNIQAQIRRNAEETSSYLSEVGKWEKDIKKKDAELAAKRQKKKKVVPPPRNSPRESGGLITPTFTMATPEDYLVPAEATEAMSKKTHPNGKNQTHDHIYYTPDTYTHDDNDTHHHRHTRH